MNPSGWPLGDPKKCFTSKKALKGRLCEVYGNLSSEVANAKTESNSEIMREKNNWLTKKGRQLFHVNDDLYLPLLTGRQCCGS